MRPFTTIKTGLLSAAALAVAANTGVAQCPADDALEDNDDCASAVVLSSGSTTGLVVQNAPADDDDYFVVQGVPNGMVLTVDVLFTHANGDIDIQLYDDAACSNEIDASESTSDNEQVEAANSTGAAKDYYFRVELWDFTTPDCNGYDLNITLAPDPCANDDSFEENDDCASAVVLPTGSTTGLLVKENPVEDPDFYVIQGVPAGMLVTVDATFIDDDGDVDLELYDDAACSNTVDFGTSVTDNEQVQAANVTAGPVDFYLEVRQFLGDCNTYDLNVTIAPDPCQMTPDDSFEDNDDCASAVALPSGSTTGLFVSDADFDYFTISVAAGEILTVDATYVGTDVDLELFDDLACTSSVDTDSGSSGAAQVTWTNTTGAAATVVLRADVNSGEGCNSYDLNVSTAPDPCLDPLADDFLEDNDDCSNATPVSNGFNQTGLFVSRTDNDYYTFTMGDGGTATLSIDFSTAVSDLDLQLFDESNVIAGDCGTNFAGLATATTTTDNEEIMWTNSTGGTVTYYLKVYAWDSDSNPGDCGNYDIDIDIQGGLVATPFCFGDGTADAGGGPVGCPCGNESALGAGEGCESSLGFGAVLTAGGSNDFAADDLTFTITQARPTQPSLLVQGATQVATPFKDGVLCTGTPTERVEVVFLDGSGSGTTTGSIVTNGNIPGPGVTRFYQQWYRDPGGVSPCGTGSNFTSGLIVTFD